MARRARLFSWMNALAWGSACGCVHTLFWLITDHLAMATLLELMESAAAASGMYAALLLVAARLVRLAPRRASDKDGLDFGLGLCAFLNVQLYFLFRLVDFTSLAPSWLWVLTACIVLNATFAGLTWIWTVWNRRREPRDEGWTWPCGLVLLASVLILVFVHDQIFAHDLSFEFGSFLPYGSILLAGVVIAFFVRNRRRWKIVFLAATICVVPMLQIGMWFARSYSAASSRIEATDGKIQKVILLTVDTLRYDMIFEEDSEGRARAPQIRRLAEESMVFHHAISCAPWTYPTFTSMMTGMEPLVHGRKWKESDPFPDALPAELETLATRFQQGDWQTSAFVFNYFLAPAFAWNVGFDHFLFVNPDYVDEALAHGLSAMLGQSVEVNFGRDSSSEITRHSLHWIKKHRQNRQFTWVHYLDPHIPYTPPVRFVRSTGAMDEGLSYIRHDPMQARHLSEEKRRWVRELYEAEVRYVDDCVGRLLTGLRESGLYDETLIIFTSDHGEEFWEHRGYEHGAALHEEVLHVPFMIKLPKSARTDAFSQTIATPQLMPTILDLCGLEYDAESLDYPSLKPLWEEGESEKAIMSGVWSGSMFHAQDQQAYTSGTMKLIHYVPKDEVRLYDLAHDPAEQHDLAALRPEETAQMKQALLDHVEAAHRKREALGLDSAIGVEVNPGLLKGLKKLGYM